MLHRLFHLLMTISAAAYAMSLFCRHATHIAFRRDAAILPIFADMLLLLLSIAATPMRDAGRHTATLLPRYDTPDAPLHAHSHAAAIFLLFAALCRYEVACCHWLNICYGHC